MRNKHKNVSGLIVKMGRSPGILAAEKNLALAMGGGSEQPIRRGHSIVQSGGGIFEDFILAIEVDVVCSI